MGKKIAIGCFGLLVLGVIVLGMAFSGSYNRLVKLDQAVEAQWAQVESQYQRRADLVPNLVETVKGAANFERDTLTAVTEARARVGQVTQKAPTSRPLPEDPGAFQQFAQAQDQLGSALSRLMVVVERYPELRATGNFQTLQSQIEGTENRIAVERQRYNESARDFNTTRNSFPTVMIAGFFGDRFSEKVFFKSQEGAAQAPKVQF